MSLEGWTTEYSTYDTLDQEKSNIKGGLDDLFHIFASDSDSESLTTRAEYEITNLSNIDELNSRYLAHKKVYNQEDEPYNFDYLTADWSIDNFLMQAYFIIKNIRAIEKKNADKNFYSKKQAILILEDLRKFSKKYKIRQSDIWYWQELIDLGRQVRFAMNFREDFDSKLIKVENQWDDAVQNELYYLDLKDIYQAAVSSVLFMFKWGYSDDRDSDKVVRGEKYSDLSFAINNVISEYYNTNRVEDWFDFDLDKKLINSIKKFYQERILASKASIDNASSYSSPTIEASKLAETLSEDDVRNMLEEYKEVLWDDMIIWADKCSIWAIWKGLTKVSHHYFWEYNHPQKTTFFLYSLSKKFLVEVAIKTEEWFDEYSIINDKKFNPHYSN